MYVIFPFIFYRVEHITEFSLEAVAPIMEKVEDASNLNIEGIVRIFIVLFCYHSILMFENLRESKYF